MILQLAIAAAFCVLQDAPSESRPADTTSSRPAEVLPLKLLYAGNAGTPYTASWEAFLKQHAAQVKVISGSALTAAAMEGFDVVIVDGEVESKSANGEPRLKSEKIPLTLNEAQGIPMLMMGGQGGFLSDDWKLKLSWHHG